MLKSVLSATLLAAALLAAPMVADQSTYDRSTETTLAGKVVYTAERPTSVVITIREPQRAGFMNEIEVQLAPPRYLARLGVEVHTGDEVLIVGARVTWNGTAMILARTITVNGSTTVLREPDGAPRW